jgi:anti-sigma factor RsiW
VKLIKTKETFGQTGVGKRGEVTLSLRDLMGMAAAQPSAPVRDRTGAAAACAEWGFALHAFFDGELDSADSFACEQHLTQCQGCSLEIENLEVMRRKIKRFALGWHAPALRTRSAG